MQWHDGHLGPIVEDQDHRRDSPTSQPPSRKRSPYGFGYDHDDRRNGNASCVGMEDIGFGGSSTRPADGGGRVSGHTLVGEGNTFGGAGGGGGVGEDGDAAVLRLLEKVLAKHSAKQNRRPSTAVRRIFCCTAVYTYTHTHKQMLKPSSEVRHEMHTGKMYMAYCMIARIVRQVTTYLHFRKLLHRQNHGMYTWIY